VEHFLRLYGEEFHKGHLRVADETMEYLLLYGWPGNVRELANEIRRLVAMAEAGAVLMPEHLRGEITAGRRTIPVADRRPASTEVVVRLDQPLSATFEHVERAAISYALKMSGGRLDQAARMLRVSRKGLYLKRQRLARHDAPSS
jgi:two-component system response regulator AtoC